MNPCHIAALMMLVLAISMVGCGSSNNSPTAQGEHSLTPRQLRSDGRGTPLPDSPAPPL
jgi:hypothetical protein